jgi:hypothetical protein
MSQRSKFPRSNFLLARALRSAEKTWIFWGFSVTSATTTSLHQALNSPLNQSCIQSTINGFVWVFRWYLRHINLLMFSNWLILFKIVKSFSIRFNHDWSAAKTSWNAEKPSWMVAGLCRLSKKLGNQWAQNHDKIPVNVHSLPLNCVQCLSVPMKTISITLKWDLSLYAFLHHTGWAAADRVCLCSLSLQ